MDREELEKLLEDIKKMKVAVIGDLCLDVYWHFDLSASEKSLETGKPTQPVANQYTALGGAGNVISNLVALRLSDVHVVGVVGDDPWGREVTRLLESHDVNMDLVLTQQQKWDTVTFIKPHINGLEQNRVDFGNFNQLFEHTAINLIKGLRSILPHVDAVIINQQESYGIHTEFLRRGLATLVRESPETLFVADSRDYGMDYPGAYLKLNAREAANLSGVSRGLLETVPMNESERAAETLFARSGKPVFVTCGAEGCLVRDELRLHHIPAVQVKPPLDTVGAGDSALAGIVAALAAGKEPQFAAAFGNLVAGITVKKLHQTGAATPSDILNAAQGYMRL